MESTANKKGFLTIPFRSLKFFCTLLAEESIKRYGNIESESKISFFDPVGFLSVWKHSDMSPEYFKEIKDRAVETECIKIDDEYSSTHFPYLRYNFDTFCYNYYNSHFYKKTYIS